MSGTQTLPRTGGALSRAPSPLLVLGAISSVQFGSAAAATLFSRIGPGGAVLLRLMFASIILSAIWRPSVRGHTRAELLLAALFGLMLWAMNTCFYHSIKLIPLGIAVTIEFVGPLTVAVLGSKRRIDLLWVGLAAIGIAALMHGNTRSLNMLGVFLALAAGGLWGFYILVNARMGRVFERGNGLSLAMCIGTLAAVPIGLAEGGRNLFELHTLLLGAAVGLMSSAIPYSFELEALRRISTNVFGVLMSIEPAMAALAGFIILGQALNARELVGMAFVVAASIGASLRARQAPVDV
jgi:inner membrane transporter RhtA